MKLTANCTTTEFLVKWLEQAFMPALKS